LIKKYSLFFELPLNFEKLRMSAFDYSRFDKIGDDDDSESEATSAPNPKSTEAHGSKDGGAMGMHTVPTSLIAAAQAGGTAPVTVARTKKGKEGRIVFSHEGRKIYEWEQSLEEVNIYIDPPPNVPRNLFDIKIQHRHLTVGLKNTPQPFIDEDTWGPVKVQESMWTMSDGEININLQKMNKAEAWDAALCGRGAEVDAITKEEVKKKMMLERFQEEHPGFDFSGASFNGDVPVARDFMGGVRHF
jgi:hypothetical protein